MAAVLVERRCRIAATTVLTLAGLAATLAPAAVRAQAASTGSLAGRITEAAGGEAIGNARVQAFALPGRQTAGSVTAGADGRYRMPGLAAGRYQVLVTRIGHRPRRVESVNVTAGATTALDVALETAPSQLDQVVTTASRAPEKVLDAPASISVVSAERMETRTAVTPVDQLREVPGVNISTGGLAQSNVVARGFNNAFSGSILFLQDYKFAGVPSLRVNAPFLVPGTQDDIERIEVLLGPASALYGPNSANGVLHVITKSPFTSTGTTVSLDGGERSILRAGLRHAGLIGERAAFKISGEYFTGRDFEYRDPAEPSVFPTAANVPADRRGRPNNRDFDLMRYSGEARLDVRPTDNTEAVTTLGYSNAANGIELTGANGASQIKNWTYTSLQQRFRWKRLFVQGFANLSDAGNRNATDTRGTYLLRTGVPIVDQSRVFAAQAQHGFDLGGDRQRFVYGADYIFTNPRTGGTINGRNEGDDDVTEVGAYVQSTTQVVPRRLDLITAIRVDQNNRIEGSQFSPRVALAYKPSENHNLRVSFNRAFQTPANFSFFLDLPQATNAGGSGYNVLARGNPPKAGWQYQRGCAGAGAADLCMRSRFAGNNEAFIPAQANVVYRGVLTGLGPQIAGALQQAGLSQAQAQGIVAFLQAQNPTAADVGNRVAFLTDPGTVNRDPSSFQNIRPLTASYNTTYEVGYKGLLGRRARLAVDLWQQQRGDVGTPAGLATPNVFFNGQSIGTYIGTRLATPQAAGGLGLPAAQATAIATQLANTLARVPVGLVTFANGSTNATDIIATYQSLNKKVDLWGTDVAFDVLATDALTVATTYSHMSKIVFEDVRSADGRVLMSNSPAHQASLSARWTPPTLRGFGWELGGRYRDAYPVNSGVYASDVPFPTGDQPVAGQTQTFTYPRVPAGLFVDAGVNYRFQVNGKRAVWSLNATNLLDNEQPTIAGGALIGRVVLTRLQYTF